MNIPGFGVGKHTVAHAFHQCCTRNVFLCSGHSCCRLGPDNVTLLSGIPIIRIMFWPLVLQAGPGPLKQCPQFENGAQTIANNTNTSMNKICRFDPHVFATLSHCPGCKINTLRPCGKHCGNARARRQCENAAGRMLRKHLQIAQTYR